MDQRPLSPALFIITFVKQHFHTVSMCITAFIPVVCFNPTKKFISTMLHIVLIPVYKIIYCITFGVVYCNRIFYNMHLFGILVCSCRMSMVILNIWPVFHMPFIEVDIFYLFFVFSLSSDPLFFVRSNGMFEFRSSHGHIHILNSISFQCRHLLHHFIFM